MTDRQTLDALAIDTAKTELAVANANWGLRRRHVDRLKSRAGRAQHAPHGFEQTQHDLAFAIDRFSETDWNILEQAAGIKKAAGRIARLAGMLEAAEKLPAVREREAEAKIRRDQRMAELRQLERRAKR